MSQAADENRIDPLDDPPAGAAGDMTAPRRNQVSTRSALGTFALVLALAAAAVGGYAAWRIVLLERGGDNAVADLRRHLDALDTRLVENERRSARNNELAATLRDQLAENERLRDRMREDLLALADRSARAESLLAGLARGQRGATEQLATADAGLMLAQADTRLRLFGDRQGAIAALDLAEGSLAQAGGDYADLRSATADARAALAADGRPSVSALLTELDGVADAIDTLALRASSVSEPASTSGASRGWWSRQFDRFDNLVTIRREGDNDTLGGPTRDGVRNAIARARLAAADQDWAALAAALEAGRASLAGCCDPTATAPLLARVDRLIAVNWTAPLPDLRALRQRVGDRGAIERADPLIEPPAVPAPPSPGIDDAGAAEETS
jgi:uncharacterized protein HemX